MLRLQIKNIIKKSGLTVTKVRIKVLTTFLNTQKPISLKEIKTFTDNIDRVTLFRALSIFEEKKIIHSFTIDDKKKLYALCNQECKYEDDYHKHNHIHFKCNDCSEVSCLSVNSFPELLAQNYIINDLKISASGTCSTCNV